MKKKTKRTPRPKSTDLTQYRRINFIANENREPGTIHLHPALLAGLKEIAQLEHRSVSWVVEDILAHATGVKVLLKKTKQPPKPALMVRNAYTAGPGRVIDFKREQKAANGTVNRAAANGRR